MTHPATIRVLKDGRVRHHWFVHSQKGPIKTAASVPYFLSAKEAITLGGCVGYIACQPLLRTLKSPVVGGRYHPISCTAETMAVTCPECMATPEFKVALEAQLNVEEASKQR